MEDRQNNNNEKGTFKKIKKYCTLQYIVVCSYIYRIYIYFHTYLYTFLYVCVCILNTLAWIWHVHLERALHWISWNKTSVSWYYHATAELPLLWRWCTRTDVPAKYFKRIKLCHFWQMRILRHQCICWITTFDAPFWPTVVLVTLHNVGQ